MIWNLYILTNLTNNSLQIKITNNNNKNLKTTNLVRK